MPRILVLLAAYNGAQWIRAQIDSILGQRGVDVQIVVRDDGSSDDTPHEVASLNSSGRIALTSAARPSGSAAQNFLQLIRDNSAAGFDLVAFSDQDDLWNPERLQRAAATLARGPYAGCSSAVTALWSNGRERILRQRARMTAADFLFEGAGQGCTFVLAAAFYRRVREFCIAHESLTGVLHYHDWAVYALARSWQQRWKFDSQPSLWYRQHDGNDTGARGSLAGVGKRLGLIRNGWYSRQVAGITRLCQAADPAQPAAAAWMRLLGDPSPWRRARMAWFCMRHGRRKYSDRLVLVVAALAGWL